MKVAPLYHALKKEDWCEARVIHTGQHYDVNMSDVFFGTWIYRRRHIISRSAADRMPSKRVA